MIRKGCILSGVGALVAMLAIGGGANASSAHDSKIVMDLPAFHGTVESSSKPCTANRRVRVLQKSDGRDHVLGRTSTGKAGGWSIPLDVGNGIYYAKVKRVAVSDGQFCAGDRSNKIQIG